MTKQSPEMDKYFEEIEINIQAAHALATKARKLGYDPEPKVDIPLAKDMAERVIGLISAVAPQVIGSGISKRIHALEQQYGILDWRVSLIIAEEVAKQKYCKFKDQKEAIEIGIRVGFAYHTLGTVASPLEGFSKLDIRKRKDGRGDFFALYFSGPIRSAGGTGASVSVLIADYVRKKMGFDVYDPTEKEVKRFVTELYDYHERITNLQYLPSAEEIDFLARHIPVQITGDPSEKIEVSNYKDLDRIDTNRIRNGVCLTLGEGIAQKAPKLWKQLSKWGKDFDLDQWNFLEEFVSLQKKIKAKETGEETKGPKAKVSPDYTFIKDLVAGRPVLTHPLRTGGFRLRYGRARTSGYSAMATSPVTMQVLEQYIATGTQLKVERPGKATVLTCCDTVEPPIVKLKDGSVVKLSSETQAKELSDEIEEVLFLGDLLVNYGDFLNRAHKLVPPGYCEEWWVQELEKATVDLFGNLDLDKLSELIEVPGAELGLLLKNPMKTKISAQGAVLMSKKLKIPLHPFYTYYWKSITPKQLSKLITWLAPKLKKGTSQKDSSSHEKIVLSLKKEPKEILELIGIPHKVVNKEFIVLETQEATALTASIGFPEKSILQIKEIISKNKEKEIIEVLNQISEIKLRDKSGVFIGARMGRPEKAKMRKLTGSPQVLFPVGQEGGRLRSFQSALEIGQIRGEFPTYYCPKCEKEAIYQTCEFCNSPTQRKYFCKVCGLIDKPECEHGPTAIHRTKTIEIKEHFNNILKKLKTRQYPDLIKGVRGTSNKDHIPEHLAKGILRAKHNIYVNKDGTIRYDMTQIPITHFKPKEVATTIERLKELGYEKDIHNLPLENTSQILELKPQDIILPNCEQSPDLGAGKILFNVANFCDDLLTSFYNQEPYYNLKSEKDLAGHVVLLLAPHTSAAIAGRIIGFSQTQGLLAHPLVHAATRRDCDGDEASVMLLMDALLNFSRQYLPAHKGAKQDAPLVLTSKLIPSEVDDMIFDMDIVWKYPLEFYEACLQYKDPWEVQIEKFENVLNTERQYQTLGFTHDTSDFNKGVSCSAYKTLPSMEEKLKGQMDIAKKVKAVETEDVAKLVIEKHFIRDIKGNLRKFSMQQFRCVKCNEKYRRPPLVGKCLVCGGKIIFTIAEGSIVKYLEPSISLAEKFNLPPYLKQTLELVKRRIEDVFGKDKEKQEALGKWFG